MRLARRVREGVRQRHALGCRRRRPGQFDASRLQMELVVTRLEAPEDAFHGKRRLGLRVSVIDRGKVVASREMEDRTAISGAYSACQLIGRLASNLGSDTAEWLNAKPLQ